MNVMMMMMMMMMMVQQQIVKQSVELAFSQPGSSM